MSREVIERAARLSTLEMITDLEAAALPHLAYGLLLELELAVIDEDLADIVTARWPTLTATTSPDGPVVVEVLRFVSEQVAGLQANALRLATIEEAA
jgi:hypothetical protein